MPMLSVFFKNKQHFMCCCENTVETLTNKVLLNGRTQNSSYCAKVKSIFLTTVIRHSNAKTLLFRLLNSYYLRSSTKNK